jgi:7-cyano-7-deazaguanine synthase
MNKNAICLLSGGLDSTVTLYYALSQGYHVRALTVHYGQLHTIEIKKAQMTAATLGIEHQILSISLPWKGSSLLDSSIVMPEMRNNPDAGDIPSTYVPARNTIFLSFALSWAEVVGAQKVFIGANQIDYSGYPDCRDEYFEQMQEVYRLGTKVGMQGDFIEICRPLIKKNKKDIILLGQRLNVDFEMTWSCYKGLQKPCNICDSCMLRAKGFEEAGLSDPLVKPIDSCHRHIRKK